VAYNVPPQFQLLTGGPEWIRSDRFDLEATAEAGAIPSELPSQLRNDKMRLMLQSLLADRFQLSMHREVKEQSVYALVVAKNGPKLQKAKVSEKDCDNGPDAMLCHKFLGGQGRGIHGQAVSMAELVVFMANWTDLPVIDA